VCVLLPRQTAPLCPSVSYATVSIQFCKLECYLTDSFKIAASCEFATQTETVDYLSRLLDCLFRHCVRLNLQLPTTWTVVISQANLASYPQHDREITK